MARKTHLFALAAVLAASAAAGPTMAQVVALPSSPPSSPSNPVQDGAYVQVGQNAAGSVAAKVEGGQQVPATAVVSPDRTGPQSGLEAYVRLPKDGNGLPQGADVRLTTRDQNGAQTQYQGVQLGNQ